MTWRNPNYPVPETPAPPRETGRRLATLPRNNGAEELRVTLSEYNGHPYVAVRLWARNQDGEWWPTKKGCSIRLGECAELAQVLADVARSQPARPERRPATSDGRGDLPARGPQRGRQDGEEFDEFAGDPVR